jgi:hypothetical protein
MNTPASAAAAKTQSLIGRASGRRAMARSGSDPLGSLKLSRNGVSS